jgi:NAD(P)-dependent dehydrogenase (short-subunit alcohol dehydrogenase family)
MNVVIGGASGIGEAVARLLPGETLVADRVGGQVTCDITDLASLAAVAAMVDHLDALVLTAGLSPSLGDARSILEVNVHGPALVLEAFDGLIGEGTVVVLLASMAAHMGQLPPEVLAVLDEPTSPAVLELTDSPEIAYMMSKVGVIRLVKRTAAAYGARGARIASVSPGVVDTPMGRSETAAGNGTAEVAAAGAFGRQADPRGLAEVIVFLCSPKASFVTGVDWLVDGGAVAALVP